MPQTDWANLSKSSDKRREIKPQPTHRKTTKKAKAKSNA